MSANINCPVCTLSDIFKTNRSVLNNNLSLKFFVRTLPYISGPLVLMPGSTLVTYFFGLDERDVGIVEELADEPGFWNA